MPAVKLASVCLNPSIDHILALDHLQLYAKNILCGSNVFYGGKGINAACAMAKLGASAIAAGFAGVRDLPGFTARLAAAGADSALLPVDAPTRRTYKVIEAASAKDTEFNERGFSVVPADLAKFEAKLDRLLPGCAWLLLTGSLPPGVPEDYYHKLILRAHRAGVKVCLDASGPALRAGAAAHPDLLRINSYELSELAGSSVESQTEALDAMRLVCDSGIPHLVVSLGSQGALGMDESACWRALPPAAAVRSQTGAGDVMAAGLLAQLAVGISFADGLRFATALATASVLCDQPGDFDEAALPWILEKTLLEKIS